MAEVDVSYAHTDEKEHGNTLALSAEGAIKGVLYGSKTFDFGNLADGAGETGNLTVIGADLGDIVAVSLSVDLQDTTLTGYVQAANVVEFRLQNESEATRDLASATIRVLVFDVT